MSNVIQMNATIPVGEYAITLTVPRGTFDRMVNEVLEQLKDMLNIHDHCEFMQFFGSNKFDAKRILAMMDKAHNAETTAFILAGLINSNGGRPSAIKIVMHTLLNTQGADKTEVVANMHILQQYFDGQNKKFL